jgi:hypothetical protein
MVHLTPERLVDLAEDAEAERSTPHLAACESCRRALIELRATLADAADVHVPEPSPLFWDHLSARVRESVADQDGRGSVSWLDRWLKPRVAWTALAAAAVAALVALVASRRPIVQNPIPSTPLPIGESAQLPSLPPLEPLGAPDDPALDLMADYGTTLEWDDMREEMAPVSHGGVSGEAVTTLNAGERQELQRLLEEEMSQPSALGAS